MDNNRTFYIMVVMTVFFIIIMFFLPKPGKNNQNNKEVIEEKADINKNDKTENILIKSDISSANYQLISIPQNNEYNLTYENNKMKIIFTPNDAMIKHAFVKYNFSNGKETEVDLVDPLNKDDGALQLKFGKWDNNLTLSKLTGKDNVYHYTRENNVFVFQCKLLDKKENLTYTIIKKYQFFDNEYFFNLDIEIFNDKNIPVKFDSSNNAFSIGWGPYFGFSSRASVPNKTLIDTFSYFNGEKVVPIKMSDKIFKKNMFQIIDKRPSYTWIANDTHYFASVIFPSDKNYSYFFDYTDYQNRNYYCGIIRNIDDKVIKSSMKIFLLPKSSRILNNYAEFKKPGLIVKSYLEKPIMYGLGNAIERLLYLIYTIVKNYGIAIIILTIFLKLILYPLTFKSMQSQQKMSKLQPKIKELQAKYKDKPDILNKETMKLYQKEKVNPFGGCLPMLLQMPLLIAMYSLLNNMVELKGASFLWINDLTLPDAVIYFSKPLSLLIITLYSLNILPFIMVITQIASSLIMPDMSSNKQAKMMMWMMPLMFFFMFYNIASGLVLYWTVMNILNFIQQLFTNYLKKLKQEA